MRFMFEDEEPLCVLRDMLKERTADVLHGIQPTRVREILKIGASLETTLQHRGICLVREGMLSVSLNQKELYVLEEGDIMPTIDQQQSGLAFSNEFALVYDVYDFQTFVGNGAALSGLISCIGIHQAISAHLIAFFCKGDGGAHPAIRSVRKGEIIVKEGELSDQVFTLIEGHAQVSTGGTIVGEVKVDELIGVIGALCGIPRIATVTASVDSMLMSLDKDDFIGLLKLRPHTVVKLIEDFARIISTSNQNLRELRIGAASLQI